MADTLEMDVKAKVGWIHTQDLALTTYMDGVVENSSSDTFSRVTETGELSYSNSWDDGTGDGQANVVWSGAFTISGGGTKSWDLNSDLEHNVFNANIEMAIATVKGILIINHSTVSGRDLVWDATVSNSFDTPFASTGAAAKVEIPAGSCFLTTHRNAGWAVTAGSKDVIAITNLTAGAGNIVHHTIAIFGLST